MLKNAMDDVGDAQNIHKLICNDILVSMLEGHAECSNIFCEDHT